MAPFHSAYVRFYATAGVHCTISNSWQVSSLAAEAGLEDGDLLVSIEGQSVRDMPHEDVVNLLSSITLGGNYQDKIELVLIPAHQVRNA